MSDHQLPKKVHISKETIKRLVTDVRQIMKHPLHDNGIYYQHDQEDMLKGRAVIIGPKDTPYQYHVAHDGWGDGAVQSEFVC